MSKVDVEYERLRDKYRIIRRKLSSSSRRNVAILTVVVLVLLFTAYWQYKNAHPTRLSMFMRWDQSSYNHVQSFLRNIHRQLDSRPSPRSTAPEYIEYVPDIPAVNRVTYLRTLFVVNASENPNLRLTNVRSCSNTDETTVRVATNVVHLTQSSIVDCPRYVQPKCTVVGYMGWGNLSTVPDQLPPNAEILDGNGNWKPIELVDARVPPVKPHKLGVCLQPAYLMADWTLLPQFFESWIGQGATYFIIYVQTVTPEFASLLQDYVDDRHNGVEVNVVPWAPFPEGGMTDDDPENPNNKAYRTEAVSALNDCVLRMRPKAKYVAKMDLDEITVAMQSNETLLQMIDRYADLNLANNRKYGGFVFRNSYSVAQNNFSTITHPSQLTFDSYRKILISKEVLRVGTQTKVIVIPEAMKRSHGHYIHEFENSQWVRMNILPNEGRLLHLRKVNNPVYEDYEESTILANMVDRWNQNYNERLERTRSLNLTADGNLPIEFASQPPTVRYTVHDEKWPNRGEQILHETEVCRKENMQLFDEQCITQWSCKKKLKAIAPEEWVVAKDKWVVL